MSNKVIHAIYDDDDVLLHAVKNVKAANHHIEEVFTPFPVHGLDKAMGLAPTRIAIASFMFGCLGLSVAIWLTNYIMIEDWPQNIGGKPSFSYLENVKNDFLRRKALHEEFWNLSEIIQDPQLVCC